MQAGQLEVDFNANTSNLEGGLKKATSMISGFGKNAAMGIAQGAGMGIFGALTGAVKGLGESFIDSNAQAETLGASLEVAAGSATKADDIFKKLQAFAASTPFEFPELVQTSISLEALGTDSMKYIDTIGNTASATGKSLDQVTQAFLDAQVGEFERLKEFGIRASSEAGKTTLQWMQNGEQMTKVVDTNNQEMIQSTLQAIWNDKYAGAMEKQSSTFNGMFSTLKDNINLTMQAAGKPIFEFAKKGLSQANEFFTEFNKLTADGLDAPTAAFEAFVSILTKNFGSDVANKVRSTFTQIMNAGKNAFNTLKNVAKTVSAPLKGAFDFIIDNKDTIIAAFKGVAAGFALIAGGSALVGGLTLVGTALAAILSPVGLLVGALALLGVAYEKNIGGFADKVDSAVGFITDKLGGLWEFIDDGVRSFQNIMDRGINPFDAAIRGLRQAIIENFGRDNPVVEFLGNIRNTGSKVMEWIQGTLLPVIDNLGKYFTTAARNGDSFNDWIVHLPAGIRPIIGYLGSLVAVVAEVIRGFQEGGVGGAIEAFQNNIGQVGRRVLTLLGQLKDLGLNGLKWVIDYMAEHGPEILTWIGGVKDEAFAQGGMILANLLNAFRERWPMISGWFTDTFVPGVTEGLAGAISWVQEHGGEFMTLFLTTAQSVWDTNIAPWLLELPGKITSGLSTLGDVLGPIATTAWEKFKTDGATYWTETIVPWLGTLAQLAFDGSALIVTKMGDLGLQALTALYTKGSEIWHSTVLPFLQRLPQAASDGAFDLIQKMSDLGYDALDGMGVQLEAVWTDTILPFLQGLPQAAVDGLAGFIENLTSQGYDALEGMYTGASETWNGTIVPFFQRIPQATVDALVGFIDNVTTQGRDALTGMYTGASEIWNGTVVPFFQRIPQAAVDALVGFVENLTTAGTNALTGLYTGASGAWHGTVVPFFQRIPQAILDALPDPLGWLSQIGADAMQGFLNGLGSIDLEGGVRALFGQAAPTAKDELEEKSPSKVFMRIGADAVTGFNMGISQETQNSLKAIKNWTGDLTKLTVAQFNKLSDDARAELFEKGGFKAPPGAKVFEDYSILTKGEQRRRAEGTQKFMLGQWDENGRKIRNPNAVGSKSAMDGFVNRPTPGALNGWYGHGIDDKFGIDDVAAKRIQKMLDRGKTGDRIDSRLGDMFGSGSGGGGRPEWLNAVMSNASADKRTGWDFGDPGPKGYDLKAAQESLKTAQGEFDKRLRENMDKMDETTGKFKEAVDKFGQGENLGTLQAQIVVDGAGIGRVVLAETNAKLSRSRDNMTSKSRP